MRRYNQWAGNPDGYPEDKTRCIMEIANRSLRFAMYHQCSRKRGYGKDGLYCKQHAKMYPNGDPWMYDKE